ncbi:GM10395 [Drosophila sechellia]|uniref:GM10395 n=1 Tax=Drosophila sechellia TaxID=7238 RepID=B4IC91_DROSE|nr:GM10395 [Drosophila sechellia]
MVDINTDMLGKIELTIFLLLCLQQSKLKFGQQLIEFFVNSHPESHKASGCIKRNISSRSWQGEIRILDS